MPLYSMKYPPTTSDSATGVSNGGRCNSASAATMKMTKPSGCKRKNGVVRWSPAITLRFSAPAALPVSAMRWLATISTTPTLTISMGSS